MLGLADMAWRLAFSRKTGALSPYKFPQWPSYQRDELSAGTVISAEYYRIIDSLERQQWVAGMYATYQRQTGCVFQLEA